MYPVEWGTVGEEHWLITSRCGECGAMQECVVTNDEAREYDLQLSRQTEQIARQLQRMEREQMQVELAAFVDALDRDLIDAGDFAR
jgi:uncharacterized Zn finger protein